jgi:hypothetical protein
MSRDEAEVQETLELAIPTCMSWLLSGVASLEVIDWTAGMDNHTAESGKLRGRPEG